MTRFNLNRKFDVITLLFSSIAYVKTASNLSLTVASLADHLETNGVIFIEPWFTPENYWTKTITANHVDEPMLKICWMYNSVPAIDNIATLSMKFMVGTPEGVEVFEETHELGLFTAEDWDTAFSRAGLQYTLDSKGLFNRGMYIARFEQ